MLLAISDATEKRRRDAKEEGEGEEEDGEEEEKQEEEEVNAVRGKGEDEEEKDADMFTDVLKDDDVQWAFGEKGKRCREDIETREVEREQRRSQNEEMDPFISVSRTFLHHHVNFLCFCNAFFFCTKQNVSNTNWHLRHTLIKQIKEF